MGTRICAQGAHGVLFALSSCVIRLVDVGDFMERFGDLPFNLTHALFSPL